MREVRQLIVPIAGVFLVLATASVAGARNRPAPKTDVNYAFGGATTGSVNATALFAPELDAAVQAAELELIGLDVELELAVQTLDRVDPAADVFWIWAGLNDYLAGGMDPAVAPARLVAAMETLYTRVGARVFVVPNLFRAGMIPLAQTLPPGSAAGLDALSAAHNSVLGAMLQGFAASHPDAVVVPVDVYSIFEGFADDPAFTNVTDSCVDVALPMGESCDGWLFVDTVHPTSAAMNIVAEAAANVTMAALGGAPIARIITIGDSFSDTGMFFDTVERATGVGFPPVPLFYDGRFADGPNVLDQFETLVGAENMTSAFAQPRRVALTAEPGLLISYGEVAVSGEVFVRRSIPAGDSKLAVLELGSDRCFYLERAGHEDLQLVTCTGGLGLGDRVAADRAALFVWGSTGTPVELDLFYY